MIDKHDPTIFADLGSEPPSEATITVRAGSIGLAVDRSSHFRKLRNARERRRRLIDRGYAYLAGERHFRGPTPRGE